LFVLTPVLLAACGESEPPAPASQEAQEVPPIAVADAPPAETAPDPVPAAESPAAEPPAAEPAAQSAAAGPARVELAASDAAEAALAAAGYRNGVQYLRLSPTQPTSSSPDQVEVAEFFAYSCIHCYNLEPYLQQWLTAKPDYINFIRVPVVWNDLARLHARAFYAAAALGKSEEVHTPFFREVHVSGNLLQSEGALTEFFGRFGVDAEAFRGALGSFSVHTSVQRADELTRRYRVDGTPTVVINGKYVTGASRAGGHEQLVELIETLAASERAPN
jgi:thiol:disulfide interchange protein DsbA